MKDNDEFLDYLEASFSNPEVIRTLKERVLHVVNEKLDIWGGWHEGDEGKRVGDY